MGGINRPAKEAGVDIVNALSAALPSASRQRCVRGTAAHLGASPTESKSALRHGDMPAELPPCFAEVWRRRSSMLLTHQHERAALEAVSASIPTGSVAGADASSGAGLYLASLVVSLRRVLVTSQPRASKDGGDSAEKDVRKSKRQKQKERSRAGKDAVALADELHTSTIRNDDDPVDDVYDDDVDGDEALIASMVYLISLTLRDASKGLVNAKVEDILTALMDSVVHRGGSSMVCRHAAAALAASLALLDSSVWAKPRVQRAYLMIVSLAASENPKTRRRGRDALMSLREVMASSSTSIAKAASASAEHVVTEIREMKTDILQVADVSGTAVRSSSPTRMMHTITSTRFLVPTWKPADASKVARELLGLVQSKLAFLHIFAFDGLAAMFGGQDSAEATSRENVSQLNAFAGKGAAAKPILATAQLGKLILALAELPLPVEPAEDLLSVYAHCLSRGAIAYLDAHKFSPPSPETMSVCVRAFVDRMNPAYTSVSACTLLSRSLMVLIGHKWIQAQPAVFDVMRVFMNSPFRPVWSQVFIPLRRYLEQNGSAGRPLMVPCLGPLVVEIFAIRVTALEKNDRKVANAMDSVLNAILRGGGVEMVLQSAPIQKDDRLLLSNAWLLPMLREHVKHSSMALFSSKLLPMTTYLIERSEYLLENGRSVEARNAQMLAKQLWSTLPSFCNTPTDLGVDASVQDIFDAVDDGIAQKEGAIRASCLAALRMLGTSVLQLDPERPGTAAQRASFGKALKKLYPRLVQVVESSPADRRGPLLEAVTTCARACGDAKLVTGFLRKAVRRLLEASVSSQGGEAGHVSKHEMMDTSQDSIRHAAADLAIANAESGAVPTDAAEIDFLERAMTPLFMDPTDSALQKKAYRTAALLVSLGAIGEKSSTMSTFIENTAAAASCVANGAKSTRLALMQHLVDKSAGLSDSRDVLIACTDAFISEAIMGTRDVSEKTRMASFSVLSAMGRAWYSLGRGDSSGLQEYLTRLSAGLAGRTVNMLAATLTALGHVIHVFRGESVLHEALARDVDSLFSTTSSTTEAGKGADRLGDLASGCGDHSSTRMEMDDVAVVPGPISILLRHSSHEVQRAALGVIKTATSALSDPLSRLTSILPAIIPGLVSIAAKSKKKETRLRVRVILERLLRKCGREELERVFPAEHAKLLTAVRKQHSRDLVKKHESKEKRRTLRDRLHSSTSGVPGHHDKPGEGDDSSDGSMSDLGDDSDSDVEKEILDGDILSTKTSRKNRRDAPTDPIQIRDSQENVLDLLESGGVDGFTSRTEIREEARKTIAAQRKRGCKGTSNNADFFKTAADGRPIFAESDSDDHVEKGSVVEQDEVDEEREGSYDAHRSVHKKRKRRGGDGDGRAKRVKGTFGEEYRSKKGAGGDVKRPGRPDPYAYIPLGAGAIGIGKALVGDRASKARGKKRAGGRKKGIGGRSGLPARR